MRVQLQPAYLLHSRPFRDTSAILILFTPDYGCVHLVARGVRSARSKSKGLLQPFVPLLISWQGKTDLPTLTNVESNGITHQLRGNLLIAGLYINELLTRLLAQSDAHPHLYTAYKSILVELGCPEELEKKLRIFEKSLLQELGYGLHFDRDTNNKPIDPNGYYQFEPDRGFRLQEHGEYLAEDLISMRGESLLFIHNDNYTHKQVLLDAKRLMRRALQILLGEKPLKSKELW